MKQRKLKIAIRAGDLDKVRKLIAGGIDVSTAFDDGTTPIQLAAREGQTVILRALAAAGADLDDLEDLDLTERMKLFVNSSFDTFGDDYDLISIEELTAWTMEAVGAQMDDKMRAEIATYEGELFRAIRIGDLDLLKKRIAAGDDVNQVRDITYDTPLTRAIQERDHKMVRELITAGADLDHQGFSTPMAFALPDLRMVKILFDAGANAHVRGLDRQTALERAIRRAISPESSDDSPLLVRFFLEAGVHPPDSERIAGEILMEVESDKAWEIYQDLLPHYDEEVARENYEEIEIHQRMEKADGGLMKWDADLRYAASTGNLEGLRDLLAAPPEGVTKELGKALRHAITHFELGAARLLIEAGAGLDVDGYEKRRGSTPLAAAAESWHRRSKEAMRLLLEAGADVDGRGWRKRTPLMYAVLLAYRHGAVLRKAVPVLLEAGADPNLEDEFGLTAWSLARSGRGWPKPCRRKSRSSTVPTSATCSAIAPTRRTAAGTERSVAARSSGCWRRRAQSPTPKTSYG